jgi:hypothetical protein
MYFFSDESWNVCHWYLLLFPWLDVLSIRSRFLCFFFAGFNPALKHIWHIGGHVYPSTMLFFLLTACLSWKSSVGVQKAQISTDKPPLFYSFLTTIGQDVCIISRWSIAVAPVCSASSFVLKRQRGLPQSSRNTVIITLVVVCLLTRSPVASSLCNCNCSIIFGNHLAIGLMNRVIGFSGSCLSRIISQPGVSISEQAKGIRDVFLRMEKGAFKYFLLWWW